MATERELREEEGGFTQADRPPERARALSMGLQNQPASPVDKVNSVDTAARHITTEEVWAVIDDHREANRDYLARLEAVLDLNPTADDPIAEQVRSASIAPPPLAPWAPPIQRPFVPARRTRHPDPPPQPEGSTRFGSHDKGIPWSAPATLTGHTERQKDHERWPWA